MVFIKGLKKNSFLLRLHGFLYRTLSSKTSVVHIGSLAEDARENEPVRAPYSDVRRLFKRGNLNKDRLSHGVSKFTHPLNLTFICYLVCKNWTHEGGKVTPEITGDTIRERGVRTFITSQACLPNSRSFLPRYEKIDSCKSLPTSPTEVCTCMVYN